MKAELINIVQNELLTSDQSITPEQDLLTSGLVDSLGVMRLITQIEMQWGITIPPEDVTLENFCTVNTIADYVDRKISK
jgi:acyl carrier protein